MELEDPSDPWIDVDAEIDLALHQCRAGLDIPYLTNPEPDVYDAARAAVKLLPASDPLPPPPPHLVELFDRRPGLLVAAAVRFGLRTLTCERCEGILNLRWEPSRTLYHEVWRNRDQLLCLRCAVDHHDYWDSMWSEVEGHWKENKTLEDYSPRYKAIVDGYKGRRAVDPIVPDEWYDLPKKEFKARVAELWFCERPSHFQTNRGHDGASRFPAGVQRALTTLRDFLEGHETRRPYTPSEALTDGLATSLGRDLRVLVQALAYFGAHLTPCPRCWTFSVPASGGGCAHCVPGRRFRGLKYAEPTFISTPVSTCMGHDSALDDDAPF